MNLYDYLARQYDGTVPRFMSADPLAEKFYSWSPYVYCYNNPLKFTDPTGKAPKGGPIILGGPALMRGWAKTLVALANNSDLQDAFVITTSVLAPITDKPASSFEITTDNLGNINGVNFTPVTPSDVEVAKQGLLVPVVSGSAVTKVEKTASKVFDSGSSTTNKTSREALRNAKDQNGIPRSQQPNKTTTVPDKNTDKPLKQYEYSNSKGEKVIIRKDNPTTYPDGGTQGNHYNAGKPTDQNPKLKQHHNYE